MRRGRKGTPAPTIPGGVEIVEAPKAFSAAQGVKAGRPRTGGAKSTPDGGSTDTTNSSGRRKRPRSSSWELEYEQIWKSVSELGAEQFTGKAKKAYENRKIVERGGRAPKEQKVPYVILRGIRKKAKEREERRKASEAEAGFVSGSVLGSARRSGKDAQRRKPTKNGGGGLTRSRGGASVGPAPSVGLMKSGVLHISRKSASTGTGQGTPNAGRGGMGRGKGGGRKNKG